MGLHRGTALFLAGTLLLVGVSAWAAPIWDTDYTHRLAENDGTFNASEPRHYPYEDLSERTQRIVDRTIDRGEYVVDEESETAPEFRYPTDTSSLYYVNRSGEVYVISPHTDSPGPLGAMKVMFVGGPLVLVGVVLCVSGILSRLWREDASS